MDKPKNIRVTHRLWANISRWGRLSPKYLVVHFTSGIGDSADSTRAMNRIYRTYVDRGSNAHYMVGRDEIWEMVDPHTYYTKYSCGSPVGRKNACKIPDWGVTAYKGPLSMSHAGLAGHTNTINVEVCSCKNGPKRCSPMDDGWYFHPDTYGNAVNLFAWLCEEFGIKVSDIIMHNQVTGKLCPAMWCNRDGAEAQFEQFKQDVGALLNEAPVPEPPMAPAGGMVSVSAGTLFYARPDTDGIVLAQAKADMTMEYTIKNGLFVYTDMGWTQTN